MDLSRYFAKIQEERAMLDPEERKLKALEDIADHLFVIRMETMQRNVMAGAAARDRSSY